MIAGHDRQAGAGNARGTAPRTLKALLDGIAIPPRDVAVTDITLDSRSARAGGVFLACRGIASHGLSHVQPAFAAGVSAVLWEPAPGVSQPSAPADVLVMEVPRLGEYVGRIADRFFGSPSLRVRIAGITGTNGKTTTAWLLAQSLVNAGLTSAYAGTLGWGTIHNNALVTGAAPVSERTTADCVSLHRQLAALDAAGVESLAMEVSSHALEQDRIAGVRFDAAAFTNLSRDHLDYHLSMEAYGAAKARLFSLPGLQHRVINIADAHGREIARQLPPDAVWTALIPKVNEASADEYGVAAATNFIRLQSLSAGEAGLELQFDSSWGQGSLNSRLLGEFNAENLLVALAVMLVWDIPLPQAIEALSAAGAPPGRMETFRGNAQQPRVTVDYAHTPDALGKALVALRSHCRGRLWCVFGCGGDRDPGKRPQMGAVAAMLADEIILTDDNPRTENAGQIIAAIAAGMPVSSRPRVVQDRARAIALAIAEAGAQDLVLIAGKGHEEYQIYGKQSQPFSDREQVCRALGVAA